MAKDKHETDIIKKSTGDQGTKEQNHKIEQKTWPAFIFDKTTTEKDIKVRLSQEIREILDKYSKDINNYSILYLYDTNFKIAPFASDRIFTSLVGFGPKKEKDVLLMLVSYGGSIEPAYQISRICGEFSKDKFLVVIPRAAKSSATLICLGAHEIHMGMLSELGPIDPQINGRPVLGLSYSLEQIAKICEKHPKSSEMFSDYLTKSLYVPDIGYYERIGESAVQYAERLISNKEKLKTRAKEIATKLVYEYKDHGFVIGPEEAREILDKDLIKTDTAELKLAEEIHQKVDFIDFLLGYYRSKCIRIIGDLDSGVIINDKRE